MLTVFVNPERCIGCRQCEFACALEHSASRIPALAVTEVPRPRTRIHVAAGPSSNTSYPVKCRHCNPAPCLQVCPTGAIHRDEQLDVVLIDSRKCIACAMCAMVCPFDVITFHEQGNGVAPHPVATKCDGCIDRLQRRMEPACAEACKVDALVFGELNDLVSSGRIRQASVALAAASLEEPQLPSNVRAWRAVTDSGAGRAQLM